MAIAIDRTGQKNGRLTFLRYSHSSGRRFWVCRCDCGKAYIAPWLKDTKSCGCLMKDAVRERNRIYRWSKTHGMTKTATYKVWRGIISRCTLPTATSWANYGGRGIKICKRWRKFENFLKDMGARPMGNAGKRPAFSIERIDNDGDYKPSNCYWATWEQQAANRRKPRP